MAQQILEGTWKEVSERAHDLPEEQPVRLTILTREEMLPTRPNEAMLEALRKVRERAKGMPESGSTEETLTILREGRAGKMFGHDPIE
jgi:hypothetical protein